MRVLVTGGTGTFGRAFVRHALTHPFRVSHEPFAVQDQRWGGVVSYSRDELKASQLVKEFEAHQPFKAFLGDVRDPVRLGMALRGVDAVVHAAALKRVDVGAYSPSELIATNVQGTINVVNAAIHAGVKRVVVLSSDKACMPTNLYGATKMCAETYAVQANSYGYPSGTRIACVRYGNILGSRGSAVHIWAEQARAGQPVTITDTRMTRFVMTIEQAVELVVFALSEMQGGEVFLPFLPSARVVDIAQAVAERIVQYCPEVYPRKVTGLRPGGEKLHESLLSDEEPTRTRVLKSRSTGAKYLAIAPTHHEWVRDDFEWEGGAPMLEGSTYRSDAGRFMPVREIGSLLAQTEALR